MSKYTFFSEEEDITAVGSWIVARQNRFLMGLIAKYQSASGPVSVLEVGPGHGAFARACRKHGLAYEGVESNAIMAERLKSDGYAVTVSTVPPLPPGESRSVIVIQHVLEHMRGVDEALHLLRECAERLKPGGLLIVCGPDITIMKDDFFDCDYTHAFPTSARRLRQIFHDAGLTVLASGLQNALGTHPLVLRTVGIGARCAYASGLLGLLFGDRAYTAKTSLYASCYAVGRFDAAMSQ
jgi:SAM-dependent methyltransferase